MKEKDPLALAVAKLRAQGMKRQQDIADQLQIHQPEVSRILRRLEDSDVLNTQIDRKKVDDAAWDVMEATYFRFADLENKLNKLSPPGTHVELKVVLAPEDQFSIGAAPYIANIVHRSHVLGVTWGRTLADAIKQVPDADKKRGDSAKTIVPLCAEPLHLHNLDKNQDYSSSRLAAELQRIVKGTPDLEAPLLLGVPAYIPRRFTGAKMDAIKEFIETIPGYHAIFGSKNRKRLIDNVDTILTGAGVYAENDDWTGAFLMERFEQEPKMRTLSKWVHGDIGGVLLPKPNLSDSNREKVDALQAGWIGITKTDLKNCVKRSAKKKRPGVVLIASYKYKTTVVQEAVRAGLVSTLIASKQLAESLEETVK